MESSRDDLPRTVKCNYANDQLIARIPNVSALDVKQPSLSKFRNFLATVKEQHVDYLSTSDVVFVVSPLNLESRFVLLTTCYLHQSKSVLDSELIGQSITRVVVHEPSDVAS